MCTVIGMTSAWRFILLLAITTITQEAAVKPTSSQDSQIRPMFGSQTKNPVLQQPQLQYVKTIAYDPNANMRDPSPVVQDPAGKRWHFWVDYLPGATMPGWHAYLRHYSAPAIDGPWVNHGLALSHATDPKAWDYAGQFSPSAIYSLEERMWYLFYSASGANQSKLLTNAQMVCSSRSPYGPWTRLGLSAWPTGSPHTNWTSAWNARFVDSGRALIVGGRKAYWTKGVRGLYGQGIDPGPFSLVASEGVYLPHQPGSFLPPYQEAAGNPVYNPDKPGEVSGYENCEFFMGGADSLLHILCTWDGGTLSPSSHPQGEHPHFVVDLKQHPNGDVWSYLGSISVYSASYPGILKTIPIAGEPTPVYEGGPPGDQAAVRYFIAREDGITHGGEGALRIGLFALTWVPPAPL